MAIYTAKPALESLETLPPEIWADVAYFLPGEQLWRLKKTGSNALWLRLRCRNVVKSVKLGRDCIQFVARPAFLNELSSIEELAIHIRRNNLSPIPGLKLDVVPPTLRKLQFNGSIGLFFTSSQGNKLYLDEQLPLLEDLDLGGADIPDYSWMSRLPLLTRLRIYRWDGKVALPTSLIHLDVILIEKDSFILPLGLETFKTEDLNDLSVLVTTLQSLSLKSLILRDFDSIAILTPTLTELVLQTVLPSSHWPSLPPTLKRLSIYTDWSSCATMRRITADHEVSTCPFELFPASLTHLTLPPLDSHFLDLPPEIIPSSPIIFSHLVYLSMFSGHITPNAAKHLPASLTHLDILNLDEHICEHLPRGLKTLSSQDTLMGPNLIKFLPKHLTELDMHYATTSTCEWYDHGTGKVLNSISKLPDFHLHKNYHYLDWKGDQSLPPNITRLKMHNFTEIGDSFFNQNLQLESAYFHGSKYFSDLSIPLLHRFLLRLCLLGSEKVTGKCFPLLPKDLTDLNLGSSSDVSNSDIQHLPRNLKILRLDAATNLTDDCVRDFPRALKKIFLTRNKLITKDAIPDLPYHIKSTLHAFCLSDWHLYKGKMKDGWA